MATIKQQKAVKLIVENHGNISKAMKEAGYTEATAKNPSNLTDSVGFRDVCAQYGLTDELILTSLVEDIKMKPQNRKPELELGAKMLNRLIERKDLTTNGKPIPISNVFIQSSDSHEEDSVPQEEN